MNIWLPSDHLTVNWYPNRTGAAVGVNNVTQSWVSCPVSKPETGFAPKQGAAVLPFKRKDE